MTTARLAPWDVPSPRSMHIRAQGQGRVEVLDGAIGIAHFQCMHAEEEVVQPCGAVAVNAAVQQQHPLVRYLRSLAYYLGGGNGCACVCRSVWMMPIRSLAVSNWACTRPRSWSG